MGILRNLAALLAELLHAALVATCPCDGTHEVQR